MTEFDNYKLKPVDYKFQIGDILIRVADGNEGELALVTSFNSKGTAEINNSSKTKYTIANYCWRAIETLPGSQAKAGDTIYCISDTEGSCQQHDSFKVKSVNTNFIYPEPGQKLLNTETTKDGWNWSKEYFVVLVKAESNIQPKYELKMPKENIGYGWYVHAGRIKLKNYYLRHDLTIQENVGFKTSNPGYWPTEAEALIARAKYLGEAVQPEIKVGSHWSFKNDNTDIVRVLKVNSDKDVSYKPIADTGKYASYAVNGQWFLKNYVPIPELDNQTSEQSKNNTIKQTEKQMTNFNLTLLIQFLAKQSEEKVDATNAKHIGILAESDGSYVGYVYANTIKELQDIVRKPENEGRKLHIFDYNQTIAQKARPVTQVSRV